VEGVTTTYEAVRLEAGHAYPIELQVRDEQMDGQTQLQWSADGMPLQVVPADVFYTAAGRRRAVGSATD
jgi:hypothetical protein